MPPAPKLDEAILTELSHVMAREPLNKFPWGFDELLESLVETGEVRA